MQREKYLIILFAFCLLICNFADEIGNNMKEIDWSNLSFGYMKTDYNVRCYYRNGAWGEIEICSEETIPLHACRVPAVAS